MSDLDLDNILQIRVRYEEDIDNSSNVSNSDTRYLVSKRDSDTLIKSIIKLNHTPGINPYSKCKTSKIKLLILQRPSKGLYSSYWWTSSDLQESSNGAKILNSWESTTIYASADIVAEQTRQIDRLRTLKLNSSNDVYDPINRTITVTSYVDKKYRDLFNLSSDREIKLSV